MGLVHVILLFGTNNVNPDGLTELQIYHRSIGSRLVLASRIFYAMFIWVSKLTVSEFLKRLARASWKKSYQRGLHFIRIFLLVTFLAVVIATLTECQPFDHYWQVVPDPGPRCRQGFAQLITMGVADIITDILLVCWPIPIIVRSRMPLKRKLSLVILFSLSLCLIGITATRVPEVIAHGGRQQYRTVWASCEILASAAVANAVVLGSFVRDRGIKRNRYRRGSTLDSIDRVSTRRPTLLPTDSDEDLFRAMGCRVPTELMSPKSPIMRPAPVAMASEDYFMSGASPTPNPLTQVRSGQRRSTPTLNLATISDKDAEQQSPHDSADALPKSETETPAPSTTHPDTSRIVSFWDVGGLLEDGPSSSVTTSHTSSSNASEGVVAHDFASSAPVMPPRPTAPRSRSSRNIFGSLLSDRLSPAGLGRRRSSQPAEPEPVPAAGQRRSGERERGGSTATTAARREEQEISLQDVGGLLR